MKTRILWLGLSFLLVAALVLTSCGPATPGEQEEEEEEEPVGEQEEEEEEGLKEVARDRTLILIWSGREGRYIDHELWNAFAIGANHQNGPGIFLEPLYYYSAFADKEIPWLAESYEYNSDQTELTYYLRPDVTWSDGVAFTAEDVAYTLNTLRDLGPAVRWGVDVELFLDEAVVLGPLTVKLKFKVPAPKFHHFITYKYDIGVYIIPKHIFEGQDWTIFGHFDIDKGWPVTTSPWRLVHSSPEQKIIDRVESPDDWWASRTGFADLPEVERIIYLPWVGETQTAQAVITNAADATLDLRPHTMKMVMEENPKLITHTYQEPPYGYVDWWPIGLIVNIDKPHFDNKDVRWALSYFVDRDELIDVAYGGAGTASLLPWPSYPSLDPFTEAISDLLETYPTNEYNPTKGDQRLTDAGYIKDSEGYWVDAAGSRIELEILGWAIFEDIGPILAAQYKAHGIDASYASPPDTSDRVDRGDFTGNLRGHGGSVAGDPYFTFRMYQSGTLAVPGAHMINYYRWHNDDFDRIVDDLAITSMADMARLKELTYDAMEIWLDELPDIQLIEWYHRIPMNTTYWTNWPTEDNMYVNGAFWHLTFGMILNELEAVQ